MKSAMIWHIYARWQFIHTESMGFAFFLQPNTFGGMNMYGNDKEARYNATVEDIYS